MTVTVVCDVLGKENNGTTIAAMNLIRSLKSKGWEIRVLCPDKERKGQAGFFVVPKLNLGPLNGYVEKVGVSLAKSDLDIINAAIDGADIVHVMTPFMLGTKAMKAAKSKGIPVTAGFHCQAENFTNHIFLMNSRFANRSTYKAFYRYFYRHVDAVHYPTQFIREVFEKEGGPTNAYVISNGVNRAFVPADVPKPDELRDKFIILFTGRYSKEKSHRILIDAVSRSKHSDKIQLIFAGTGPLEPKLREMGEKLLKNQPIFKFFTRDEMLKVVNYADLYVHPAEIEIEAIACLEAISCGLVPVIANSPRCATKAFALSDNNLFNVNDSDDLAAKIDYWIENPDKKAECSQRYLGFTKQFDHDYCMDEMERMLLETIKKLQTQAG